jgi:hypothetical protein
VNARHDAALNHLNRGSGGSSGSGDGHRQTQHATHSYGVGYRSRFATGVSVQDELAKSLWSSVRKVDDFYFSLVDAARYCFARFEYE